MTKYRGNVEAARQQLLATGSTPKDAKRHAPRLAEIWEAQEDSRTRPHSWLGGRGIEDGEGQA